MTPDQLSKSGTEHGEQVAFFAYCAVAHIHGFTAADVWASGKGFAKSVSVKPAIPPLEWIHAIHNQGHGDKTRGGIAKAEGVRSGIVDIFLPYPVMTPVMKAGLYIEMKKPSIKPKKEGGKGGMSDEQIKFRDYCRCVGYEFKTCYTWREAVEAVKQYLGV